MSECADERVERCIAQFTTARAELQYFADNVTAWLSKCETKHATGLPDVYAVKSRLKDVDHLRAKLLRKPDVCEENFFQRVNDLAGVRVLHLWPSQRYAAVTRRSHQGGTASRASVLSAAACRSPFVR